MPRKISDQIAALEQRMEQERQRMRDLKAQESKQMRKDDARRKIILGGATIAMLASLDGERRQRFEAKLHQHIGRPTDRDFLGLPPLPSEAEAETAQASAKPCAASGTSIGKKESKRSMVSGTEDGTHETGPVTPGLPFPD
jgi:hypothetical protein